MKTKPALPKTLMHGLLASVVYFMSRSGMDSERIERSFRASMRETNIRNNALLKVKAKAPDIGSDTVAGAVLRAWHRYDAYLDNEARPVPLKLRGRPRSLAALIRQQDPDCDVDTLAKDMLAVGLIRKVRSGAYLPTKESATIRQLHPLLIDHVAKSVMRLVETVYRNTDPSLARTPLIERYAHVPDLDPADAKDFAVFAQQQGTAYLAAIDDWLETRRVQSGAGKRRSRTKVAAGVHLVAYLGEQPGYGYSSSAVSAQCAPQNLAHIGLGQGFPEVNIARNLV
ncbi:MAG: DUF6502 family protein [Pseudomonadota bacterium]